MKSKKNNKINIDIESIPPDFIDSKLVDKVTLWSLRIILKLGGHKELIDSINYIHNEDISLFLGLSSFEDTEDEKYSRQESLAYLKEKLIVLEKKQHFTSHKLLDKNLKQIYKLVNLNKYEVALLEFVILVHQFEILEKITDLLGQELNSTQVKRALSVILDIPQKSIDKAFQSDAILSKASLVLIDKRNSHLLLRKLDSISSSFIDNMLNLDEDVITMLKDSLYLCSTSALKLKDYKHIQNDIDLLLPYLKRSLQQKKKGVNILFYGLPGTGKTELAKVVAKKLKTNLFEVSYTDEDDEAIDGENRLKVYKSAQALLSNKKALLMYDEAEDIFQSTDGGIFSMFIGSAKRQKDKAWINRVLENNIVPTIWITNNINSIDNALLRSFDMNIEVPIPVKSKREEVIRKYSKNFLNNESIKLLANNEHIAPALISSAAKVVSSIETKDSNKAFTHILSNTLKAQGHGELQEETNVNISNKLYNLNYVNTSIDLKELQKGIQNTKNARLCLYGPPGTGKSAFGKYIADILDQPLIIKKGSDLMGKYVGETEKNIANAFKEAKLEKAVLVFDEVDSFLRDRTEAKSSWEITQVNEMLVQMENFEGVFIATTNLMDNLDVASIRRFDLKLEFSYLKGEQAVKMFNTFSKELHLKGAKKLKILVEQLHLLTPGDFAAVIRQNNFRPIEDVTDLLQRLKVEIVAQQRPSRNVMGFIV